MKNHYKQPEPPPDHPNLMFWFNLTWILMIIALFFAFRTAKVEPDYQFDDCRNEGQNALQITKSSILSQAPPYLFTEHKVLANLSAYNPVEEQCDSTPDITASGKYVREGYVANNCLPFGTIVKIDGKYYEVQDRMNKRYNSCCECFDILMWNEDEAKIFGRQYKEVIIYKLK